MSFLRGQLFSIVFSHCLFVILRYQPSIELPYHLHCLFSCVIKLFSSDSYFYRSRDHVNCPLVRWLRLHVLWQQYYRRAIWVARNINTGCSICVLWAVFTDPFDLVRNVLATSLGSQWNLCCKLSKVLVIRLGLDQILLNNFERFDKFDLVSSK